MTYTREMRQAAGSVFRSPPLESMVPVNMVDLIDHCISQQRQSLRWSSIVIAPKSNPHPCPKGGRRGQDKSHSKLI